MRKVHIYRVTRQLESYIRLQSIWGVPPACGPLLQLATAQAGQGNSQNWLQQTIGLKLTGHPVPWCKEHLTHVVFGFTEIIKRYLGTLVKSKTILKEYFNISLQILSRGKIGQASINTAIAVYRLEIVIEERLVLFVIVREGRWFLVVVPSRPATREGTS